MRDLLRRTHTHPWQPTTASRGLTRGDTKHGTHEESQQSNPCQPDGRGKSPGQFPTLS